MPVLKPYKRTVRQLADGSYRHNGNSRYISHPDYAEAPGHFIRAFQIIQKDLLELFDYIEPSKKNCDAIHIVFSSSLLDAVLNWKQTSKLFF